MEDTFNDYEAALLQPGMVKKLNFLPASDTAGATKRLPDRRIITLQNLEGLGIYDYQRAHLDLPEELKSLPRLKSMAIFGNRLKALPEVLWELKGLETLLLTYGQIDSRAFKIGRLSSLKRLLIQSEVDTEAPEIGTLENLERLELHIAECATFPASIENLNRMVYLSIYNTKARQINWNFAKLTSLEEFRWGKALHFPVNLADAPNLKVLTFDDCSIQDIITESLAFKNLKELKISRSLLEKVPPCIATIESLHTLKLTDAFRLHEIDLDFSGMTMLEEISFGGCTLLEDTSIDKLIRSLKTIRNARVIDLSGIEFSEYDAAKIESELSHATVYITG
jgi:Leucine-rich repeat (LRR) protein